MASVLANTGISVVGRVVSAILGLGITALLGRTLGVEQFGQYALILSFGAILHVITDGGLYLTLTREIAQKPKQQKMLLSAITGLRLALFITVFGVGALLLVVLPNYTHLLPLFIIAGMGFLFQSLSQLLMGVFQAHSTIWKALIGDLFGRLAQFTLVFGIVIGLLQTANGKLFLAVVAFSVGTGVAYIIHVLSAPVRPQTTSAIIPAVWKRILKRSWPLGIMLLLNAIYFRIDMVMLSWFRSGSEVGWYGLAYRIIESGLFLPAAFGGLLLPKISQAVGTQKASQLIEQALLVMAIAGGAALVVLSGAATELVTLFVGVEFAQAGTLLGILAVALVVMFFGNIFGFTLVAAGQQRKLLRLYAWLAVGNTLANLLFIPRYGASAAAWTTVGTEAIATIVAGMFVYKTTPYKVAWKHITSITGAFLVSTALLRWMVGASNVVLAIIVATTTYLCILALTGSMKPGHMAHLLET